MITYKSPAQLDRLRAAGHLLARVLDAVIAAVHPGVTTAELNALAESRIRAAGARPSFLGYRARAKGPRFPAALCTSVNDQVVHAPPSARVLQAGDIIGLDLGLAVAEQGQWLYVDMAKTVPVGRCSRAVERLLRVTEAALVAGMAQVAPGKVIADIGRAVQKKVEAEGYSVVRQLVGHGVGFAVHEEPRVPNYVEPREPAVKLTPGLVIAIEPMVNVGAAEVNILPDGWTVVTADGSLSAHVEHTVAVTETGHEVLTDFPRGQQS